MTNPSLAQSTQRRPDQGDIGTPTFHNVHEFFSCEAGSDPFPGDDGRLARLASIDTPRMAAALAFLAGCEPETFDYVLDCVGMFPEDEPDPWDEPEPYCAQCGGQVGIFLRFGLEWRHFRGDGTISAAELFDPGHAPAVAWRLPEGPGE